MQSSYSAFQMSPLGISTAAKMYGLNPPEPESATVLELGCCKGSNLIAFATAYPLSTIIGIDIEPERISCGQQLISSLGIGNVFLYSLGINELISAELGKFDFIIIHEIFSLLDKNTCADLLDFCEQHLSSQGVLAVKWNTLPGSQVIESLRGAIALHCQNAVSDEEKISAAKAMLIYMNMAHTDGLLKEKITEALALSDAELAVRYIYNNDDTRYFSEFNDEIEKSNLKYVGDVAPQYEMEKHYGSNIELVHSAVTKISGRIAAQQYLDFAVNRDVRFSLLISNNNISHPREVTECSLRHILEDMHWAANYQRKVEEQKYYNRQGLSLISDNDLLCRILDVIGSCWPLSISTSQIIKNTLLLDQPDDSVHHSASVLKILSDLYIRNISGFYIVKKPSPYNISNYSNLKLIFKLSEAVWSDNDEVELNNLWGEVAVLTKKEFDFIESGLRITDEKEYFIAMKLASKGLLTGSDIAWLRLYQQSMALEDINIARRRVESLMLFSESKKNGGFYNETVLKKRLVKKNEDEIDRRALDKARSFFLSGKVEESFILINDLMLKYPHSAEITSNAARMYFQSHNYEEFLKCILRGLSHNSQYTDYFVQFAHYLAKKNDQHYSLRIAHHHLRVHSKSGDAWDLLAKIYTEQHNSLKLEYCARMAVEFDKKDAGYLMRLGNVLSDRGLMHESREILEKAVQLSESTHAYFQNYSCFLFSILHNAHCSAEEIMHEHQKYGKKVSQWARSQVTEKMKHVERKIHSRIRIGFVSGDFYNHPVSQFIYPVLNDINREKFDLIGYNVSLTTDSHTQLYSTLLTHFYNVQTLSYVELANKIIKDEIDILIDLSGHTGHNRLPTFGLKPAPVQMSWIGYPGTTGLNEVDYYLIGSELAATGKLDKYFIEKIASFPSIKFFEQPSHQFKINPLPALKNGHITFGSFNRPQKITSGVLDCWAKILIKIPESKFLLASMNDQAMIEYFIRELEMRGVKRHQIMARLKVGFYQYLEMHNEVDVLLDTFPYTGGTTTSYAYGMGVPTLTCKGDSVASHQGSMIMAYLELNDFIADNEEEYISKALGLVHKYEYLNTIRLSMRNRIREIEGRVANPACYFEKVLETAWLQYKKGLDPESISIASS